MKKSKITFKEKMSWWKGDLFTEDIIELAVTKAYRDLMRTIRGFSANPNHDIIFTNVKNELKKSIAIFLNLNIKSQKEFDMRHAILCQKLIIAFDSQLFTVGQAQKWINMTFKYLHLLEYEKLDKLYEFCHVPVDSYMLKITNYHMTKPWSKIDDYKEYLKFQEWFRNKYNNDIPLDAEFYLWLKEAKKSRGNL